MNVLTLEEAMQMRNEALESDEPYADVVAVILTQLIKHLNPKIIQITTIEEDVIVALKSDGTLWKSIGGLRWVQLPTP